MKKTILMLVGIMLLCTGCGSGETSEFAKGTDGGYEMNSTQTYDMEMDGGLGDSYGTEAAYSYDAVESAEESASYTDDEAADAPQTSGNKAGALDREMLVYRGSLSIDTLDFNTSVSDFKALVNEKGGFVESESYSDNYSTSGYYAVDDADKHNLYYATVRVPSAEYETIMNSATNLGDVRNRYSNASNVTQQYSTYTSQLEVYEAEYERYLTLLENATEDEYALQIENELFDIQIQIAQLQSGITNIENDVAYSYIDITIKEVLQYEETPAPSNTFLNRFKNTCKDSWESFLNVLEEILFWIIMNIYGIVIVLVIVLVLWIFLRKKKAGKNGKRNDVMNIPASVNVGNTNPEIGNTNSEIRNMNPEIRNTNPEIGNTNPEIRNTNPEIRNNGEEQK